LGAIFDAKDIPFPPPVYVFVASLTHCRVTTYSVEKQDGFPALRHWVFNRKAGFQLIGQLEFAVLGSSFSMSPLRNSKC
jgi:hypothetical protein